jgi:hypothetical protein
MPDPLARVTLNKACHDTWFGRGEIRMTRGTVRWALITLAVGAVGLVALEPLGRWFDPWAPTERTLAEVVAGADRIRVRTGGTCHRDRNPERTLFEETEPAKIESAIRTIRIDTMRSSSQRCRCCGDLSPEFYRGADPVATVSFHHGNTLRWRAGWHGDGRLSDESAAEFRAWLVAHGVAPGNGAE